MNHSKPWRDRWTRHDSGKCTVSVQAYQDEAGGMLTATYV